MDISRQLDIPSDVSGLANESVAVKILHQTLVNLREELIKRDKRIELLESKVTSDNSVLKGELE